jgi:glycyl-tRNA synthetase
MKKEEILSKIALSRGIYFPSAEVFSNRIAGLWEYGPIGVRIFNNFLNKWRQLLYEINAQEISGSTILPKIVVEASGHIKNFFDYTIKCEHCGAIYRVDKLIEEETGENVEGLSVEEYYNLIEKEKIKCPSCKRQFTRNSKIEKYSLMISVNVADETAFLRPEACQSIYLDFQRIYSITGQLPLAIAQTGKAYRNEISPRKNLIRERELYQSDIEVFFLPSQENSFLPNENIKIRVISGEEEYIITGKEGREKGVLESNVSAYYIPLWQSFLVGLGFKPEEIRFRKLIKDKPFYAKESYDVEIKSEDDWIEVTAINHRGDHDLKSYMSKGAEIKPINGEIPNVFEISAGTDRIIYLLLLNSLHSDEKRNWLSLRGSMAPYPVALFPLLNKEELVNKAKEIIGKSKYKQYIYFLNTGNIGKSYRKSEEIGVPIAFTVDYQTIEDNTITVRDRETMEQFRINADKVDEIIELLLNDCTYKELKEKYYGKDKKQS